MRNARVMRPFKHDFSTFWENGVISVAALQIYQYKMAALQLVYQLSVLLKCCSNVYACKVQTSSP